MFMGDVDHLPPPGGTSASLPIQLTFEKKCKFFLSQNKAKTPAMLYNNIIIIITLSHGTADFFKYTLPVFVVYLSFSWKCTEHMRE